METLLVVTYLGLAVGLSMVLAIRLRVRRLPVGPRCCRCFGETFEIRLRWLGAVVRKGRLYRRWCPQCGWEGMARIAPGRMTATRRASSPVEAPTVVVLRSVEVDGRLIDVAVHCHPERPRWAGRLAFTAGEWRWTDDEDNFRGESLGDILVQTLTLSDRAIMARVRQALYG